MGPGVFAAPAPHRAPAAATTAAGSADGVPAHAGVGEREGRSVVPDGPAEYAATRSARSSVRAYRVAVQCAAAEGEAPRRSVDEPAGHAAAATAAAPRRAGGVRIDGRARQGQARRAVDDAGNRTASLVGAAAVRPY